MEGDSGEIHSVVCWPPQGYCQLQDTLSDSCAPPVWVQQEYELEFVRWSTPTKKNSRLASKSDQFLENVPTDFTGPEATGALAVPQDTASPPAVPGDGSYHLLIMFRLCN